MSDAVLLADTLAEGVAKCGPRAGFDFALPVFERKMLSRSSRVVVGSREKAKEMHSALALQPARKTQREAGFDMQQAIRLLRAKGIGAGSAADPRGLDAVVEAEATDGGAWAGGEGSSEAAEAAEATGGWGGKRKGGGGGGGGGGGRQEAWDVEEGNGIGAGIKRAKKEKKTEKKVKAKKEKKKEKKEKKEKKQKSNKG